jgi:D-beta-D-heptose 7-phosphate kinase/D-beta-D-heptose 1-phosphate adenosyltransferase
MLNRKRLKRWLQRFKQQRILVVGDVMLDRYVMGSVTRISPEAPVPVVQVDRQYGRPGGAANVAANIRALGGQAVVAGFVGDDADGAELMELMKSNGIETDGILRNKLFRTTVKMRVIAERQQVVRVDYEEKPSVSDEMQASFMKKICRLMRDVSGVIIEDYGKGVITQMLTTEIERHAETAGLPVGLDPNPANDLIFTHLTLATPNYKEARSAAGLPDKPLGKVPIQDVNLEETARILLRKWNVETLVITLGAHGMYILQKGEKPLVIPARAREVFDVSGAGDTVIATSMLAISAGINVIDALAIANCAAGVVVGKLGTAVCTPSELLDAIEIE